MGRIASAQPVLVATAHGTRSSAGLATVAALVDLVRSLRPELEVRPAFVDVSEPFLTDVVADVAGPLVVVPVLLSRGFHVRVDIPGALTGRNDAVATRPLGPDRAVSLALAERLDGARGPDTAPAPEIVLVATGSSDPDAAEDLAAAAADLASQQQTPVHATVMNGPGVPFADELARLGPHHVDVVPYLLAEGVFYDRLRDEARAIGVRTVGSPIGAHPRLAELILARYDAALIARTETPAPGR